ncbi:MAG: magnesium transporter [Phycisphaerales bacterium]|jgi:magnesium transporter|nr:magnesium transporter [Phycisphaerales bacterium]MBT7171150.1 magnesium transporter [Phycisphaerales bacterium]
MDPKELHNTQLPLHLWIENRQFGHLKQALRDMEIHELADMLVHVTDDAELAIAFRMLPTETAADILGEFEPDQQEHLLSTLSGERVAQILNEMPPDDRTELLEELPGKLSQQLLNQLVGKERKIAIDLMAYPEETIGRLMTPEFVAVRKDWSIEYVLRHIRRVAAERETVDMIYVVDDNWNYLDELRLQQILTAEDDQLVEDLMDHQGGLLNANDDQETAIDIFKKYDATVLPAVDSTGILVGIVTVDDVLDLQEEESTEDMQKMAGMAALDESYLSASSWDMLLKRLPWLLLLLAFETGAVLVLKGFEKYLAMVAMFMPLINASAGNTGSQVSGLMIRAFAVNELGQKDWTRIFRRELLRGMLMGVILATFSFGIAYGFEVSHDSTQCFNISISVAVAMFVAVTLANLLGAMLPFAFKSIGMDPAVTSGPFIACLMDISSILIFFSIASAMVSLTAAV